MKYAIVILFLAAQAQAATLYVSTTGTHDTNAPAFGDWTRAATNIQAAINASTNGDTVRVAPGTYTAAVTINKNNITVQGGNGTLWDADLTIIDRLGEASSIGVLFSSSTNSTLSGFTVTGCMIPIGVGAVSFASNAKSNTVESVIVRGNTSSTNSTSGIRSLGWSNQARNCVVVGNSTTIGGISSASYLGSDGILTVLNCISEANVGYQLYMQVGGILFSKNCIYGNTYNSTSSGGNITNSTTNSVMRLFGIAPASEGVGTNLVWAGVAAYIPRIGSLAQGAGIAYAGIDEAKSGDGGPMLWPVGAEFLGRDSSTNANHGMTIGGVTESTNAPFAGGWSAAFDGASGTSVNFGNIPAYNYTNNFTVEGWMFRSRTNRAFLADKSDTGWAGWNLMANHSQKIGFQVEGATIDGTNSISTGVWHHVAASMSNGTVRLYLDGSLDAIHSGKSILSSAVNQPLLLGNRAWAPIGMLGNLSEVRIWNVARTPAEIAAAYTNRLTGTEPGLVGYWRLDETDTSIITTGPFNIRNPTLQPSFMEAF